MALPTRKPLTEADRKLIEARQTRKERERAQRAADRQQATQLQNSHLGRQLAQAIGQDPELMQAVYSPLAIMSNELYKLGKAEAGQLLGAIALGMDMTMRQWDSQHQGFDLIALDQIRWPEAAPEQPASPPAAPKRPTGSKTPAAASKPATAPSEAAELASIKRTVERGEDTGASTGSFLEEEAQRLGISVQELAARLESSPTLYPDDDAPDGPVEDLPGHDEPAQSPEPEDTPQRKAAAQRRAAKRAKQGK